MLVFISYSRDDIAYKNALLDKLEHLPLEGIQFWHDGLIEHGVDWMAAIQDQLRRADSAILLVSNSFLRSKFCQHLEVMDLLETRRRLGLSIYPVLISAADLESCKWVSSLDLRPKDSSL